nr:unnamed protein product [Callosobruchus analis]
MNNIRSLLISYHSPIKNVLCRSYAFKSDLKIKWVRPQKIPCFKPEKTGDLEGVPQIDKEHVILDFKESKELSTADNNVKKLFSLEFAPHKHTNRLYIHEFVDKVKRHEYDIASIEVKIAKWTGVIRALQECMERFPRNKKLKVFLKELIDKRKKHLKYLRRWDYKRFEWLLERMNMVYKPPPNEFHWVTRKESLRKLTDQHCEKIRTERINQYKQQLENEQPAFLEEKIRTLQFIRNEQKECGAEVTVTQEEIDGCRKLLEDLKLKRENVKTK